MNRYPWRDTSSDIAGGQPPQWETPAGAQKKVDEALAEANEYTDQQNVNFNDHIENTVIHVTQADKTNWNSKAAGDHTHPNATPTTPGFMSAADKTKLNGIEAEANKYVHPASHPPSIITQDSGNRFVSDAEKAKWNGKADQTEATVTTQGLMSPADKEKLDGIETAAEVNQNAFSAVNNVPALSKSDTLQITGGTGITITTDPASKRVTVTATGEATPGAHASSHITGGSDVIPDAVTGGASGLMSGADAKFVRQDGETKEGAQEKADAVKDYIDGRLNTSERAPITLQPGLHVVSSDLDAAFRLAGLQGRTVLNYQSQIGIFGVLNPYVIRYGKNLLPPFYEWDVQVGDAAYYTISEQYNATIKSPDTLARFLQCEISILAGGTYTLSAVSDPDKIQWDFLDSSGEVVGGRNKLTDKQAVLVVPDGATQLRMFLYNDRVAGTFTFRNVMLNIGSTALPFVPREDSMLALETELHADPDTGANPDIMFERDGQYFKLAKWKKEVLDGSLNWSYVGTAAGFKRLKLPVSDAVSSNGYNSWVTKYDASQVPYGDSNTIPNAHHIISSQGGLFISVPAADSGWGDVYTPTADEIKAYFNGWRMYEWTQSTNIPYNGTGTKAWARCTDGLSYGNTLPTILNDDPNWRPYQLLYQLASPVVEPIRSEGMLTIHEGYNQVEVGTGLVVRESVKAKNDSGPTYWYLNANNGQGYNSPFRNKVDSIKAIYKNSMLDTPRWVLRPNNPAYYGGFGAYAINANYDISAAYSVTYLMLDKYPTVDFDGTYAENEKALLLDTVRTLQKNTMRISVLESKKAEKDSPAWITPTLLNGWVRHSTARPTLRYYKDSQDVVHLEGVIRSGVPTSGIALCNLPVGYRPALTVSCVSYSSNGSGIGMGLIDVLSDGTVQLGVTGTPTFYNGLMFISLSFLAEQ